VGKTTQEVFPKHIADQFDANDKKLMETLVPQVVEEVVPQKEGPPLNFLSTQFPLFDSNNKPYAICGISTDITERKLTEQKLLKHQEELEEMVQERTQEIQKALLELRKSEERLNLTFEATSEGVWDWDIKTGEVFFSSQWLKSLGYEPNEIPGHVDSWKNLVHPDDMPEVMEKLNAHFEGKSDSYECENRLKTKSGAWRWNLDRGKVVARDAEGNPVRMVGSDTDITQRKKIENDLKAREGDLAQAQGIAHLGSWVWDVRKKKLSWSDEMYRIFGLERKEFKPTYEKYLSTVHKEDRELVHRVNRESVLGKTGYDIKHRILLPNGDIKYVQQKSKTDYDPQGYPLKVVGTIHDIDKMKLAEEKLLKNREKFRLLYNQISAVLEGTSSAISGEKYFQSLVFHLASTLGFNFCFIGQLRSKNTEECHTRAFFKDGENIPNFLYNLRGTPCELIYHGATIYYLDNLQNEFPGDSYLKEHGLNSCFGVPVFGKGGYPIAHLVVMDREPKDYSPSVMSILSLFAARAGAEMIRIEINNELEISRKRLRELNKKLHSVREEEKLHLAREIHDELGQVITYCKLDLLWIKKEIKNPGEKIDKKLESMVSHLDDSLRRVRRISSELRPEILDMMGISEAMKWQAQKFKDQTLIEYELEIVPEKIDCERDRSIDLFRIFQEALTNISRHAQATLVQINFVREETCYRLKVKDNGKGFDPPLENHSQSLGILGMKERSLNWGGKVDIQSKLGMGTTVTVIIPIKDNYDLSASE
jgi:PAS domain S-box-containing protein